MATLCVAEIQKMMDVPVYIHKNGGFFMTSSQHALSLLKEKKQTVCFAESLTGGLIAATLVENPGASAVLGESYVTYSESAKQRLLGVKKETLENEGVVSAACAAEMAAGARIRSGADWAVSATGLAGPEGGTDKTPVGTVFIGVSGVNGTHAYEYHFEGERMQVRLHTVEAALRILAEGMERV